MSGGKFDYLQYRFPEMIDLIEQEIIENNVGPNPNDYRLEPNNFREETLEEFKKGIELLKKAQIYAQRIDWLLSSDDSEDTFHERLSDDLSKISNQ